MPATNTADSLPRFYFNAAADDGARAEAVAALKATHEAAVIELAASKKAVSDAWATSPYEGRATKVRDANWRLADAHRAELLAHCALAGGPQ